MSKEPTAARVPSASWLTIAFTLLVGAMLWASLGLSRASAWMPQAILLGTLLLLLGQLATELIAGRRQVLASNGQTARAIAAAAWIGLLLLAAWLLGAAPGSALFCIAWLRWRARESWFRSLAIGAGLGLSLWLLFAVLLRVSIYTGVLGRLLL